MLIPNYIFDAIVVIIVNINIISFIGPFKCSHVLAFKQYLKNLMFILGLLLAPDEKLIHLSNGIVNTNFYFSLLLSDIQPSVS